MAERFLRHRLQEKLIIITQKKTGIAPVFLFNKYNFMVSFLLSQNLSILRRSNKENKFSLFFLLEWSGRQDSNLRPQRPKRRALPTVPRPETLLF